MDIINHNYLRAFVIGSSFFVFLPFFFGVSRFKKERFNFDYISYTFLAPVALGLMNVFSLLIAEQYHLSSRERYLVISILAPSIVLLSIVLFDIYNYTTIQWIRHTIKMYLLYFFMWNVVVYNLDKYV